MDFQKRIWKMTAEDMTTKVTVALDNLHKVVYATGKRNTGTALYDMTVKTLEELGLDHGTALHLIERRLEKQYIRPKEKPFRGASP